MWAVNAAACFAPAQVTFGKVTSDGRDVSRDSWGIDQLRRRGWLEYTTAAWRRYSARELSDYSFGERKRCGSRHYGNAGGELEAVNIVSPITAGASRYYCGVRDTASTRWNQAKGFR